MFKRILIPTDGSPFSNAAALAAIQFAKETEAEVVAVFVGPEYTYPIYWEAVPASYPTEEEHKDSVRRLGESYLDPIARACDDAKLPFTRVIAISNRAAEQLVETARANGCDLICMGSHGRSGWGQLLLGSVTAKVLALCDIPVLVYRVPTPPA